VNRLAAYRSFLALLFALMSSPAIAWAHGGEDHGPPAATVAPGATEHVAANETELFSVVVKYAPRGTGGRLPLRIYVADSATSAPVSDARVRFEIEGVANVRATSLEPGIYTAAIPEPRAGSHADAIVTVEGTAMDLITLEHLEFGPIASVGTVPASGGTAARSGVPRGWVLALTSLTAALALVTAAVVRRRRVHAAIKSAEAEG
jgi:cobalt-zinc-cadmium efflux system membrane fusion protein